VFSFFNYGVFKRAKVCSSKIDHLKCAIDGIIVRSSRSINRRPQGKLMNKADFIEGAAKAMAVLECFGTGRQKLNASQAAERAGLTRACARRHLLTLEDLGYLEASEGFFWLTPRVLRFAGSYLASALLPKAVQPTLNRLAAQTGQAFSVAVLDETQVVIVARSGEHRNASTVLPHGIHLGARLPAYVTSTGRVLMSGLTVLAQRHILNQSEPIRFTAHTLVGRTQLLQTIAKSKRLGYAETVDEHELGVRALAIPLRDLQGNIMAALNLVETTSVSQPHESDDRTLAQRYLRVLTIGATEIRGLL
jgi:IclR family transcriptional regulator, pca regulon regulatory protein